MGAKWIEPLATDPLPPATNIMPGPEKVNVLADRYAKGMFLWNPSDADGKTSRPPLEGRDDVMAKIPLRLIEILGDHALNLVDPVGPKL